MRDYVAMMGEKGREEGKSLDIPILPPKALVNCQALVAAAISFNGIAACKIKIGVDSDNPTPTAVTTCRPSCRAYGIGYLKKT